MTPSCSVPPFPPLPTLGSVTDEEVRERLSGSGLVLDVGGAVLRVRSTLALLSRQLRAVYPHFPLVDGSSWADIDVRIEPVRGLRRWVRPQIELSSDGQVLFEPFPADSPLPLMEWGCNWLIGQRMNHLLLFHAGVLEKNGRALVMPALPGSGKSTLTAALSQRGWRLLSDEFGAFDPAQGRFIPMLKPIALKNESIRVMAEFAPDARVGPHFPRTRKGTVAHMAASAGDTARRAEPALPGAIVLPRWRSPGDLSWQELPRPQAFAALAFNAFNYAVLGDEGLDAALSVARECPAWTLEYTRLDDAVAVIDAHWPGRLNGG